MHIECILVVNGEEDAAEWRYRERGRNLDEIANLKCYGPISRHLPKTGLRVIRSTSVRLAPCRPGQFSPGPLQDGIVYEITDG